ncbi:MAG: hypothetical protein EXR21_09105 [Flavobacteriaceae bacterium]|nr:hypothetical protein [Flavobacteriaceae bacterium]
MRNYKLKKWIVKTFFRKRLTHHIKRDSNAYTLVAENTTDKTEKVTLLGAHKQWYLGYQSQFGNPEGIKIYISELGTTIASYAQFLSKINRQEVKFIKNIQLSISGTSTEEQGNEMIWFNDVQNIDGKIGFKPIDLIEKPADINESVLDVPMKHITLDCHISITTNIYPNTRLTVGLFTQPTEAHAVYDVYMSAMHRLKKKFRKIIPKAFPIKIIIATNSNITIDKKESNRISNIKKNLDTKVFCIWIGLSVLALAGL